MERSTPSHRWLLHAAAESTQTLLHHLHLHICGLTMANKHGSAFTHTLAWSSNSHISFVFSVTDPHASFYFHSTSPRNSPHFFTSHAFVLPWLTVVAVVVVAVAVAVAAHQTVHVVRPQLAVYRANTRKPATVLVPSVNSFMMRTKLPLQMQQVPPHRISLQRLKSNALRAGHTTLGGDISVLTLTITKPCQNFGTTL